MDWGQNIKLEKNILLEKKYFPVDFFAILISNKRCVSASCQIKWGRDSCDNSVTQTPVRQSREMFSSQYYYPGSDNCNRISRGPGGCGWCLSGNPHCLPDYTHRQSQKSESRGEGGWWHCDWKMSSVISTWQLVLWSACLPNHYPFSPWLCATGHRGQLPPPPHVPPPDVGDHPPIWSGCYLHSPSYLARWSSPPLITIAGPG